MKKNELKNGMILQNRKGYKMLLVGDKLIGDDDYSPLINYNDDLKNRVHSNFDIIKVYDYKYCEGFNRLLEDDNLDLIWDREEIKLTDKEIEILKALKILGFGFLARDENTDMYAYNGKPHMGPYRRYWVLDDDGSVKVNGDCFDFIKWEDKEPINIDDLLKGVAK